MDSAPRLATTIHYQLSTCLPSPPSSTPFAASSTLAAITSFGLPFACGFDCRFRKIFRWILVDTFLRPDTCIWASSRSLRGFGIIGGDRALSPWQKYGLNITRAIIGKHIHADRIASTQLLFSDGAYGSWRRSHARRRGHRLHGGNASPQLREFIIADGPARRQRRASQLGHWAGRSSAISTSLRRSNTTSIGYSLGYF